MKNYILIQFCFFVLLSISITSNGQDNKSTQPHHKVLLPEAHVGDIDIDTRLLDSYGLLPENIRQFYFDARKVFTETEDVNFDHSKILESARKNNVALMGGPLLGDLQADGVTLWLRPSTDASLKVKVISANGNEEKTYSKRSVKAGIEQRIIVNNLSADTDYNYEVYAGNEKAAQGSFRTAPESDDMSTFKVTFGSCFHKIGLHNPNLIDQILKRNPQAMMLLGDIAVDDREDNINMHRSDYLLRDVSAPWQKLAANIAIYAAWDDHDYLNNDLSGVPARFKEKDREALRQVWYQNWNNPENEKDEIYFNTRTGPVEIIMLDTRSCRKVEKRGEYGSYLGDEQLTWLKDVLKKSKAPFKIISSGTMWSDDISNGKDSWGTWDTKAREEIFNLIETENISGVLLISGDRHGARGITIPRSSGFKFHEFEGATLGGVPGPNAMADDPANQLFGYHGKDFIAFGEFTFDMKGSTPLVTYRLIYESGKILEEHGLPYDKLTPR